MWAQEREGNARAVSTPGQAHTTQVRTNFLTIIPIQSPPPARAAPLLHKNNSLVDNNLTHLFQKLQKVPFGSAVCFPPQSRALRTHDGFKIGWLFRALEAGCSLAVFCCCCFEILVPSRGVFPKTPPKTTINLQNRHFAKTPKINPKKTQIFVLA